MEKLYLWFFVIYFGSVASVCCALEIPKPDEFSIKKVDAQKILYVHHADNGEYI